MPDKIRVALDVNGHAHDLLVEPRLLLLDLLRDELGLKGTHAGCEQGVCGACTVVVDGQTTRSCLLFAAQLNGAEVTTVEALASADGTLHPVQQAFTNHHGLQCGFCTPGMLMSACALLEATPAPTRDEAREAMSGNLCRCTGYQNVVDAVCAAGHLLASQRQLPVDTATATAGV
jgi:carbon-monoxide dehydrogenase small subunit